MSRPTARSNFPIARTRPSPRRALETDGILGFSAMISVISQAANKTGEAIRVLVNADDSINSGHVQFINTEIRNLKDQIGILEALLHTEGANPV